MNSIPNLTIHFPGKLVFGKGCIANLPDEIALLSCKKVFIVTIAPLLSTIEELTQKLEAQDISVSINTGIVQEPTFADFEVLMEQAREIDPDLVIGIGGGSVLDVAKLVAALLDNTQLLA